MFYLGIIFVNCRDADGNKKFIPKPDSDTDEKMLNPEYNPRTLYVPKDFLDNETPVCIAKFFFSSIAVLGVPKLFW